MRSPGSSVGGYSTRNEELDDDSCKTCLRVVFLQTLCCEVFLVFVVSAVIVFLAASWTHTAATNRKFLMLAINYQVFAIVAMSHATIMSAGHMITIYNAKGPRMIRDCTMRILLMIPIYAVDAGLACVVAGHTNNWSKLLSWVREVYEGIALVSFVQLLTLLMQGPSRMARIMSFREVEHVFFVRPIFRRLAPGNDCLNRCIKMVVQYAYVMVIVAFVNFVIWIYLYQGAPWDDSRAAFTDDIQHFLNSTVGHIPKVGPLILQATPYDWTTVLFKFPANGLAMYHLILLYEQLIHNERAAQMLQGERLLHKVLGIKFIVMLTLWQESFIKFLSKNGFMPHSAIGGLPGAWQTWEKEHVAAFTVNFLLCIELIFFAAWHRFAYPARAKQHTVLSRPRGDDSTLESIIRSILEGGWGFLDPREFQELSEEAFREQRATKHFERIRLGDMDSEDAEQDLRGELLRVFKAFALHDDGHRSSDSDGSSDTSCDDDFDSGEEVPSSGSKMTRAQLCFLLRCEVELDGEDELLGFEEFYRIVKEHLRS